MFENVNKFDRLFIILTGSSINSISEQTWKKLENEGTIAINHSFKTFPSPTYLFFSDKDVMYAYWQYYRTKKNRPVVYARDRSVYKKVNPRYPELVPSEWIDKNVDTLWELDDMTCPSELNITPIFIFNCLKDKRYKGNIYLLGADFYIKDGKYHFDNYHADYYKKRRLEKQLSLYRQYFEHPYLNGLNIFNCNPDSALTKFPMVKLRDIL